MAKKSKGGQLKVPGTERKEIEEVTAAAEELRNAKAERKGLTAKVADAEAHLSALVLKNIKEGKIALPDKATLKKEPIYVYESEDGKLQSVKWSIKNKCDVSGHDGDSGDPGDESGDID